MSLVRIENPPGAPAPVGQYGQLSFVRPGSELLHVAGQLPLGSDLQLVSEDFREQALFVYDALAQLLKAAGSSMRSLAYLRTYMTRPEDYAAFKEIRAEVYARHDVEHPPPATTIAVSWLVGGSLIELDAVAVIDA